MILYHYTTGSGVFGIINSQQLHCSNVKYLNDPSENAYGNDIIGEVINECTKCKNIFTALYSEEYQKYILYSSDKYVASFSRHRDSLAMWNYYAGGNGYNIGFNLESILDGSDENLLIIELIYDRGTQLKMMKDLILSYELKGEKFKEFLVSENYTARDPLYIKLNYADSKSFDDFNKDIFDLMIRFKHEAYRNEEEIRLMINKGSIELGSTEFKVSNQGVFIEYYPINIKLYHCIESITVHPLNNELHRESILNFLSSKIKYNSIDVHLSNIPFRLT